MTVDRDVARSTGLLQDPLTQTSDFSPGAFRQRELAGMRQKQGLKVALKKSEVLLSSTLQQPWLDPFDAFEKISISAIMFIGDREAIAPTNDMISCS
jgi:hypothetical protein